MQPEATLAIVVPRLRNLVLFDPVKSPASQASAPDP
jgi:hypothetical protein